VTELEVFFDGACPLCVREMRMLEKLDKKKRIAFTNIAAKDFDPERIGIDWSTLMERMHARLPDGTIITGVEVFRRLYAAVGFGPLVWLSRAPGLTRLLDFGYEKFAKNRMRLTGRCVDDVCEVSSSSSERGVPLS
jgi:predicted DCC family thiol-disulfide oxidoreductase YuxK